MSLWDEADRARREEAARAREIAKASALAKKAALERIQPVVDAVDLHVQQFISAVISYNKWPKTLTKKRLMLPSEYRYDPISLSTFRLQLHVGDRQYGSVFITIYHNREWVAGIQDAWDGVIPFRKGNEIIEAERVPADFSSSSEAIIQEIVKLMTVFLREKNIPLPR